MRKLKSTLLMILVASMMVLIGCKGDEPAAEANEPKVQQPKQPEDKAAAEQAAVAAADAWLKIVDAGQYAKSWDEAAEYFRNAMPKEQWEPALRILRERCGKLISRKLLSNKYTPDIPNAPVGQYVIIQYQARFENKTAAVETITPMLDKDGKWRVSGYFIR